MLYLAGIFLSFFLSIVLLSKANKSAADYMLAAWLALTGFHLLGFYMLLSGQALRYPIPVAIGFSFPLAQGPFLYLYTCRQTSPLPFQKRQLLHFLPVLLSCLLFLRFYLLPTEQQVEVFRLKGQGFETESLINVLAIYSSGIVYIALALSRLLRYRRKMGYQFSNTEKINFNWLLYLILWMAIIWITILFVQEDKMIFGAASLFVLWLGYFGIRQVRVFSPHPPGAGVLADEGQKFEQRVFDDDDEETSEDREPSSEDQAEKLKYQKSTLSDQDAAHIHERLKKLMQEEKPFTNPDLTLTGLARRLDVHPNHLSQVINSREKKIFYEMINEKRVEEFIQLVSAASNRHYTFLALAFDCGFNSKASFNRNFKKYTGLSPREYLKQQQMAA
ncbi:MAG: helix-turn-helix domain-containing protein [Bacteroidia bacterium]|nr:helix-turn-helix domain-containing protein [Bacteroidia bacterium]